MIILDEIKMGLSAKAPELENLKKALGVENAESKLQELGALSEAPDFWDDLERSQTVLKQIKNCKNTIDGYNSLKTAYEDLETMIELAEEEGDEGLLSDIQAEYNAFESALAEENLKALLSGEYDECNAILTFHAGAGGTEAQDWAEMLYRMYTRYAQRHDFKITVLDYLDGEEAGLKSATIQIEGQYAYG